MIIEESASKIDLTFKFPWYEVQNCWKSAVTAGNVGNSSFQGKRSHGIMEIITDGQ